MIQLDFAVFLPILWYLLNQLRAGDNDAKMHITSRYIYFSIAWTPMETRLTQPFCVLFQFLSWQDHLRNPWLLSAEGSGSKEVTRLIKLLVALLEQIGRYIFKKNDFIYLLLQRITAILRELNAFLLEAIVNYKYNTESYYNLVINQWRKTPQETRFP